MRKPCFAIFACSEVFEGAIIEPRLENCVLTCWWQSLQSGESMISHALRMISSCPRLRLCMLFQQTFAFFLWESRWKKYILRFLPSLFFSPYPSPPPPPPPPPPHFDFWQISGSQQGSCECGNCTCKDNYYGENCDCYGGNDTCIAKGEKVRWQTPHDLIVFDENPSTSLSQSSSHHSFRCFFFATIPTALSKTIIYSSAGQRYN